MKWLIELFRLISDSSNWRVEDFLSMLSLFFVVIGGVFALNQWIKSNQVRRSELINQIIEKIHFDKDIVRIGYRIEYDSNWYNEKFHHGDEELESAVDKFLAYYSYICYLVKNRNVSKKEFKILSYDVNRICSSHQVQSYLWNLYHFSKEQNTDCSFQYLIEYGIETGIIDEIEFLDCKSNYYPQYLYF